MISTTKRKLCNKVTLLIIIILCMIPACVACSEINNDKNKNDWTLSKTKQQVPEDKIYEYIDYARNSSISNPKTLKFSAWGAHPLLETLNNAFLLTHDEKYLKEFIYFYNYFRSNRADILNKLNYKGEIKPQWYRLDRYNIFNISPYFKYSKNNLREIVKKRGWVNLKFSDINYSGLFLDQLLRFSLILKENHIQNFDSIVEEIIEESSNVIKSHEEEWVSLNNEEGYYIFPKNSPFFIDGVEMPINEAAIFGTSLVRMYILTNDESYLKRAKAMLNRWAKYFKYSRKGFIYYPYATGHWYNGWSKYDRISINTPHRGPDTGNEPFNKAALTIKFIEMLSIYDNTLTRRYLEEFHKVLVACEELGDAISFFPNYLDLIWPDGSYHASQPITYNGWLDLACKNRKLTNKLFLIINADLESNYAIIAPRLYLQLMSTYNVPQLEKKRIQIKPSIIKRANECHIETDKDSVVYATFQHLTPKHNRIYLNVNDNLNKRIRLSVQNGKFHGKFYAPAKYCIKLSWEMTDKYSHPQNEKENLIFLDVYSIKE